MRDLTSPSGVKGVYLTTRVLAAAAGAPTSASGPDPSGPTGPGAHRRSIVGMRRLFMLVAAVVLVDTAFYAAIAPLLPHYESELGLSKTAAGILTASYAAGTLAGRDPRGLARGDGRGQARAAARTRPDGGHEPCVRLRERHRRARRRPLRPGSGRRLLLGGRHGVAGGGGAGERRGELLGAAPRRGDRGRDARPGSAAAPRRSSGPRPSSPAWRRWASPSPPGPRPRRRCPAARSSACVFAAWPPFASRPSRPASGSSCCRPCSRA